MSDVVVAVRACVEAEGPIHADLLVRRIGAASGYARAGSRIAARVKQAVSLAVSSGVVDERGSFLWSMEMAEPPVRGAAPDGWTRPVAYIAPEELSRALQRVVDSALSLTEDDLVSQTARALGYGRTGAEIDRALRTAIAAAIAEGIVRRRDGLITIVRP